MVRVAALRALAHRFSFAFLLMGAFALMMLGKVDAVVVDSVRGRINDAVAPILDAFARPAATVSETVREIDSLARLHEENLRLRAENEELQRFQEAAYRLEAENLSLRMLLNYRPEQLHRFITARVIANDNGAFVRSLGVNLGHDNGIRDGQAAVGSRGLVGRVVQTGERSARLLLITDLNARIPVVLEQSRQRAVLGGDNTDLPMLLHLPPDSGVAVGDRVVTSGDGDMFPPGLLVGMVESIDEGGTVRIRPAENIGRLEYVRIMDFRPGSGGILLDGMSGLTR